jgi:hypothetical protein
MIPTAEVVEAQPKYLLRAPPSPPDTAWISQSEMILSERPSSALKSRFNLACFRNVAFFVYFCTLKT